MIDRKYYEISMATYYCDFFAALFIFFYTFYACMHTEGALFAAYFVICVISIHRAGVFLHEISHQYNKSQMKLFTRIWDLTVGGILCIPSVRFIKPHLTHHSIGVFGTPEDPQYLLLRSDRKLAFFVLVVIPLIVPFFNVLLMIGTAIFGQRMETAVENFLRSKGHTTGAIVSDEHTRSAVVLSRYYLVMYTLYAIVLPQTIPLFCGVMIVGWFLTTLRVPLEHAMIEYKDKTTRLDHKIDSFTVEAPIGVITQPISLRFHTAHHMYAGVPYHNLKALHQELKASDPVYRKSCVTFWQAVKGPGRQPRVEEVEAEAPVPDKAPVSAAAG